MGKNRYNYISLCIGILGVLVIGYMAIFLLDAYNIIRNTVQTSAYITLNEGGRVQEIDNFELDGTTVVIDENEYKDIQVAFFSSEVTPEDKVYFSEKDSMLFKVFPKSAGKSFIFSSGYIVIMVLLTILTVTIHTGNIGTRLREISVNRYLLKAMVSILVVYIVLGVSVYGFLTLYGH